jgi:DNA primase
MGEEVSGFDLVETVRQYVRMTESPRGWWLGLCPFHQESTPSFSVNAKTESWYCHACHRGGDVQAFIDLIEKNV